jgi:coenzyme F420-0:L-glutamate ligase / coenzyme F420-1:gamma-L-glutamate ligase
MPSPPAGSERAGSPVTVIAVHGIGEVGAGADLAALVVDAAARDGIRLGPGDCLVISSKVASKALGLTW